MRWLGMPSLISSLIIILVPGLIPASFLNKSNKTLDNLNHSAMIKITSLTGLTLKYGE
jgi:hypothetical protein